MTLNLEAILGLFGKDLTLTGRSVIWPAITEAISQKVWAGYGAFSFWQPWRGPENPALSFLRFSYWLPPSAHQGFLDIPPSVWGSGSSHCGSWSRLRSGAEHELFLQANRSAGDFAFDGCFTPYCCQPSRNSLF